MGVEAGAAGLARWPRQQARVIHAAPIRGQLTQFAGKLIWAPWGQLKGCVGDGLRGHATPFQGHLCAFAVTKAHAGLPRPARYSTRSRALARPRPPARASPLWFKTPVDALWRVPARQRAARRSPLQSPSGFPKEGCPWAPDPRLRESGRRRLAPLAGVRAVGGGGGGAVPWGLAPGAVQTTVLPRGRSLGTHGTGRRVSGPRPGREPGGPASPRQARAGPEPDGDSARGASLPGQCSFPRAREASQEVEVFPKAVAARRCPTQGRRGWRPRRRWLLLPEAQPPKGFKKTLLHGVGAGGESPAFPFLKSRSWPKLLFLWLSGHVIDGGAGARSPAPPSHPPEPRCVGGVVPTWKAGDAGRLTAGKTSTPLPPPTLTSSPDHASLPLSPWAHRAGHWSLPRAARVEGRPSAKALPHPTAH